MPLVPSHVPPTLQAAGNAAGADSGGGAVVGVVLVVAFFLFLVYQLLKGHVPGGRSTPSGAKRGKRRTDSAGSAVPGESGDPGGDCAGGGGD